MLRHSYTVYRYMYTTVPLRYIYCTVLDVQIYYNIYYDVVSCELILLGCCL